MPCANCGTATVGRYCHDCGQRTAARLTVRGLLAHFGTEITSFEQPVWRTLRGLARQPGVVASEYAAGKRLHYTNPVKWALLCTSFSYVVGRATNAPGPIDVGELDSAPAWLRPILEAIAGNAAMLFVLLLLPFAAVAMKLCFRRTGRTVAEEMVLVLYAYGFAALLQALLGVVALLGIPGQIAGILPVVWTAWGAVAFHRQCTPLGAVARTVLAHALWVLLLGALALLGVGIAWLCGAL